MNLEILRTVLRQAADIDEMADDLAYERRLHAESLESPTIPDLMDAYVWEVVGVKRVGTAVNVEIQFTNLGI